MKVFVTKTSRLYVNLNLQIPFFTHDTRLLLIKLIVEIKIVYICMHSDQGQMVFCFENCPEILWEKIVVVIEKKIFE